MIDAADRDRFDQVKKEMEKMANDDQLKVKKLVGNLDYTKIRNSKTILTEKELAYCENDCLVIYEYIKKFL